MDAINKIHEFLRFGSVLGLERMNVLMEKLGNPQDELKVIHVAGTNGKGSICRYVYEVLQAAGYHTGLYTSPYIEVFNERIEFDGAYISGEDLNRYTETVLAKAEEMVKEGEESPTEFEVVTAIALLYFKEQKADYVVLEVGLGGRGDSTNVVKHPLACIIASISLDHTDRLGETIPEIAAEKAGIIKAGCPVISVTDREDAKEVLIKKAAELDAPFYDVQKIPCEVIRQSRDGSRFEAEILGKEYDIIISMAGLHQVQNALAALYAIALLDDMGSIAVTMDEIWDGFENAKQIGRFEILQKNPYVIIDGAHNPDGSKALRELVNNRFTNMKILMTVGILQDKDVDEVLDNFLAITKDFVVTEPDNPRKMPASDLAEMLTAKGGNCTIIESPKDAAEYVKQRYEEYGLLLFAGSLYLIGEMRGYLHE